MRLFFLQNQINECEALLKKQKAESAEFIKLLASQACKTFLAGSYKVEVTDPRIDNGELVMDVIVKSTIDKSPTDKAKCIVDACLRIDNTGVSTIDFGRFYRNVNALHFAGVVTTLVDHAQQIFEKYL